MHAYLKYNTQDGNIIKECMLKMNSIYCYLGYCLKHRSSCRNQIKTSINVYFAELLPESVLQKKLLVIKVYYGHLLQDVKRIIGIDVR